MLTCALFTANYKTAADNERESGKDYLGQPRDTQSGVPPVRNDGGIFSPRKTANAPIGTHVGLFLKFRVKWGICHV